MDRGKEVAMNELWYVLLLSLLPAAGNFSGAVVAEFWKTSPRILNWALHAASGIVIAIIAVELMPEVIGKLAGWWIAFTFAGAGLMYVLLGKLIRNVSKSGNSNGRTPSPMWMIYVAVAVDLSSDGLMIG